VPVDQRGILTALTYVVLSAIPLVSIFLAVVDMDMERSKNGHVRGGNGANSKPMTTQRPVSPLVPARASQGGNVGPAGLLAANGATPAANKRSAFWADRQKQQGSGGASSARTLINDPDKDLALAGVE